MKVLLQTYFGDVRDCYRQLCELPFDGIGLDMGDGDFFFHQPFGNPHAAQPVKGIVIDFTDDRDVYKRQPIPHEKDAKDFYPLSNWFLDLFSKEYDGLRRNQSPHCGFEYPTYHNAVR